MYGPRPHRRAIERLESEKNVALVRGIASSWIGLFGTRIPLWLPMSFKIRNSVKEMWCESQPPAPSNPQFFSSSLAIANG